MSERGIVVHVKIHQNGKRTPRNRWMIDTDIPIFTQDRAFVEKWV